VRIVRIRAERHAPARMQFAGHKQGLQVAMVPLVDRSNLLKWVTVSEKKVLWHVVERSVDGFTWTEVGRKSGKDFSATMLSYELEDLQPLSKAYYRLRTVDDDGAEAYSKSIFLIRRSTFGIARIFPTPASDLVTVQFTTEVDDAVVIRVLDCMGRIAIEQAMQADKGIHNSQLNIQSLAGRIVYGFHIIGKCSFRTR